LDCLKQRGGGYEVCFCPGDRDCQSGDVGIFVTNAYLISRETEGFQRVIMRTYQSFWK
jgi:hypothetical protein